ncbi:MAG: response regulator transcription factor [Actinomycetota bacterium]
MIRVLIADDHELIRFGFAELVGACDDMTVVGQATTGIEAVELAAAARPDVVLMDIRMPGLDGIEATRRITTDDRLADTHVLVLTTFDLDRYVYGALEAGASGFLLKDVAPAKLLEAIRVVAAGDALIAPSITRRLIADFTARPDPATAAELEPLTDRERDVLAAVGRGRSNDEIATELFISPLTAKTHVSRLRRKLDARDRAQLVVIAYRTGLVTPTDAGDDPVR